MGFSEKTPFPKDPIFRTRVRVFSKDRVLRRVLRRERFIEVA